MPLTFKQIKTIYKRVFFNAVYTFCTKLHLFLSNKKKRKFKNKILAVTLK